MSQDNDDFDVIDASTTTDDDASGSGVDRGDELAPAADSGKEITGEAGKVIKPESTGEESGAEEKTGSKMIPKARFDQVNGQRKELARRVEELEALVAETSEKTALEKPGFVVVDGKELTIEEAEMAATNLILDGDIEKASLVRSSIYKAIASMATVNMQQANVQSEQAATLEEVADYALEILPELDTNPDLLEMVMALRDQYAQTNGGNMAGALHKAVNQVAGRMSAPDATAAQQPVANKGEERRAQQVARNIQAATSTPPSLGLTGKSVRGSDNGLIDVRSMSEGQFKRMSEEDRARARGDIV